MIVPPSLPAKTLKEFIDLAKKEPGKYNFTSAGVASTTFLAGETFRQAAGLQLVHVPTKGVPDAMTAVLRGDVAFWFAPIPNAIEQSKAGKVRMLAVSSPKRYKDLPEVPTVAEAGAPTFKYASWFGLMAPKGTPKAVVDKVNADVRAVAQDAGRRHAPDHARLPAVAELAGRVRRHHQGGREGLRRPAGRPQASRRSRSRSAQRRSRRPQQPPCLGGRGTGSALSLDPAYSGGRQTPSRSAIQSAVCSRHL